MVSNPKAMNCSAEELDTILPVDMDTYISYQVQLLELLEHKVAFFHPSFAPGVLMCGIMASVRYEGLLLF